jgi:hypothetical protein
MDSLPEIPIGGRSPTGSIRISEDCFVADWVILYAPWRHQKSRHLVHEWIVIGARGYVHDHSMTQENARRVAEQLNTLAATAVMLRREVPNTKD